MLIYCTFGLGYIVMEGTNNTLSPIYGIGTARDITDRFAFAFEANIQQVEYYTVGSVSVGMNYSFDIL